MVNNILEMLVVDHTINNDKWPVSHDSTIEFVNRNCCYVGDMNLTHWGRDQIAAILQAFSS